VCDLQKVGWTPHVKLVRDQEGTGRKSTVCRKVRKWQWPPSQDPHRASGQPLTRTHCLPLAPGSPSLPLESSGHSAPRSPIPVGRAPRNLLAGGYQSSQGLPMSRRFPRN